MYSQLHSIPAALQAASDPAGISLYSFLHYFFPGFEHIKEFEEEFEGHVLMTIRMVLRLGS